MGLGVHKLTGVATALLVVLAQLACSCPVAEAMPMTRADAGDAAHRCCKHAADATPASVPEQPADPPEQSCRHCSGATAAVASQPNGGRDVSSASPAPDGLALFAVVVAPAALSPAACTDRTDSIPPPTLSPTTLLGLRCALNL